MTTTNISPTSIVVEVLRGDNYDDWSACMKSYMLAQDLWDFIEPSTGLQEGDQEGDSKALRKKNAAALHAIQVSCAPHMLSKIRSITSAKDAWDTLANLQTVEAEPAEDDESQGSGAVSNEMNGSLQTLSNYAHNGDWDAIKTYLIDYPNAMCYWCSNAQACRSNCKDMALYLYSVTPFEFLCQGNGHHGSYFLQCAIGAQMLDIALDFLHRCPRSATTMDEVTKKNALTHLSEMPHLFPSASRLALWQQWIYSCIPNQSIATTDDNIVRINMPDQSLSDSKNIILQVSSKLRGFAINLLAFLGIKQIYDLKKIHIYSDKILRCMCEYISTLDFEEYDKADVHGAFHNAVKNGMVEFITEVIKACPHLMETVDDNGRDLFMSSIANRQEKVFSLFYGLEASRAVSLVDRSGNKMLYLAAKLSPPSQLARISGAALQMQRELQWYKEVESIMNPTHKVIRNEKNQTATELFTDDHKDLLVKGEQWMKEAATSCTVVGALIITIMFTVAFTVPGGNDQQTGYPVFKDEKSFTIFIVADAISLFSSSTSVLMFLGILTSRYAEEDFLKSLPTKFIIGLSMLFFSIEAMMVTFCAALIIMLDGRLQIIIPIVLLATIPVTLFMLLQFPLLVEIFVSTYGPGIFNRKIKRWYPQSV